MTLFKILPLCLMLIMAACKKESTIQPEADVPTVTKPEAFQFGTSLAYTRDLVLPLCDSVTELLNEPILLPTAVESQSQLDCWGFTYAGAPRKAELIFADDSLDIVWILTEAEEESYFIEEFTALFGEPTHIAEEITFFLDHGVGVRNNPHEVLFISDRLKEPYGEWLDSL